MKVIYTINKFLVTGLHLYMYNFKKCSVVFLKFVYSGLINKNNELRTGRIDGRSALVIT